MIEQFLIDKLNLEYGEEITLKIINGYKAKRKTTFRINTIKANEEKVLKELEEKNIKYERAYIDNAFVLPFGKEKDLWELECYKNGEIYLQSLSSMLPPLFLEIEESSHILDMAAAPGGKTTQMAALSNNKACITACELNPLRAEKLKFNVNKMGASRVTVLVKDARQLDEFFRFERILLDAPCSGSGTLYYDDDNSKYFTPKLIEKSSKSQYSLLKKAIKALKKGGVLIYSTCSILKEENEEILIRAMKGENVHLEKINIEDPSISLLPSTLEGVLTVCPNEVYEGFFISKIVKD